MKMVFVQEFYDLLLFKAAARICTVFHSDEIFFSKLIVFFFSLYVFLVLDAKMLDKKIVFENKLKSLFFLSLKK